MGNPPAESMAAVDPAAVQTLKPLDRLLTKCELLPHLLLILNIMKIKFSSGNNLENTRLCLLEERSYRNENRDTDAGQGCDTKISLRANVGMRLPFRFTDILESSVGCFRPSRISSST